MTATNSDIPLSLYIHFPWCARKCPYCDFNSHESQNPIPFPQYVNTLVTDLDRDLAKAPTISKGHQLVSIFMGGGTPSLCPDTEINRLLEAVRQRLDTTDSEVTLEANPGTFDQAQFSGYYQAGVNRISIGAQSFSSEALKRLGRIHDAEEISRAFEGARAAGFERINLDLMHGLPGQSLEHAMLDLDKAIALAPEHISWYQLTIEPNTVFHKRPPTLPLDDTLADIASEGLEKLDKAGYSQYETSAYARENERARHNVNYWEFGDYLGIGAGAHGKVTRETGIVRSSKTRVPADYLQAPRVIERTVGPEELTLEFLMNALRLTAGFEVVLFEQRTGLEAGLLEKFLERATDRDMLTVSMEDSGTYIQPTEHGRAFLNELLLLVD